MEVPSFYRFSVWLHHVHNSSESDIDSSNMKRGLTLRTTGGEKIKRDHFDEPLFRSWHLLLLPVADWRMPPSEWYPWSPAPWSMTKGTTAHEARLPMLELFLITSSSASASSLPPPSPRTILTPNNFKTFSLFPPSRSSSMAESIEHESWRMPLQTPLRLPPQTSFVGCRPDQWRRRVVFLSVTRPETSACRGHSVKHRNPTHLGRSYWRWYKRGNGAIEIACHVVDACMNSSKCPWLRRLITKIRLSSD